MRSSNFESSKTSSESKCCSSLLHRPSPDVCSCSPLTRTLPLPLVRFLSYPRAAFLEKQAKLDAKHDASIRERQKAKFRSEATKAKGGKGAARAAKRQKTAPS
jgi:hypothetical protein